MSFRSPLLFKPALPFHLEMFEVSQECNTRVLYAYKIRRMDFLVPGGVDESTDCSRGN
jgi:hypothetical protein